MRVLVTGTSGFIGSHVTRLLINAGHQVMALILPGSNLWRLQDILSQFEVLHGSLQDISALYNQLLKWQPQACISLAWHAEPKKYLNSRRNLESLQGNLKLLQILSDNGCEQFIGAGTCAEYEMKTEILTETDRIKPDTLYAASKLSFQFLGEQIASQAGMRFAWGRIFYLYGPQEDPQRLVPAAIIKLQKGETFAATPGEQTRDYLHVRDVASAFINILEHRAMGVYNICSGKPVKIRTLLNLIGEKIGRTELITHGELPYRKWEPMFIRGDNARLKEIGWKPRFDLESGLNETINWWKHHMENE